MNLKSLLVAALAASSAVAQGLAPPADLQPGQPYRILAVTDSVRNALTSDINAYDAFVTADANSVPFLAALNTQWRALASTNAVSASVHTGTDGGGGVPIYRPDGVRVFDDYGHMWDAQPALAAPRVTTSGVWAGFYSYAWTGTGSDGLTSSRLGGPGGATAGLASYTSGLWMDTGNYLTTQEFALYAISDVLTTPEAMYPPDLQPGDQFRVLVVTDSMRDATSSNIADYDAFVTADAQAVTELQLYGTSWRAVASTPTVSARVHTDTDPGVGGVPIYRPDGVRIVDDYAGLWGTMTSPMLALPTITSSGATTAALHVWSGTGPDGSALSASLGGGSGAGAYGGNPLSGGIYWIWGSVRTKSTAAPLYAISDLITVPYPSVQQSRVGTPPNADALLPGQTSAPIIGGTWDPIVDHTTFVTNAAFDVLFFGVAQANVPLPGLGTVLIDQLLGDSLLVLAGQTFSLPIADNAALLGVSLSTQALSIDWSWGMHLTNALDITIGTR